MRRHEAQGSMVRHHAVAAGSRAGCLRNIVKGRPCLWLAALCGRPRLWNNPVQLAAEYVRIAQHRGSG
jgi:hypothetical protein